MEDFFYINNPIIGFFLYAFVFIAAFSLLRKIYLWFRIDKKHRLGIIKSFFIFFSIHDVHNASSTASKKFRGANNLLNGLFWGSLIGFAIAMVFNTNDKKIFKTKGEQYWESR
jgi:flagellar biosynthesis protein FliR